MCGYAGVVKRDRLKIGFLFLEKRETTLVEKNYGCKKIKKSVGFMPTKVRTLLPAFYFSLEKILY